MNSKVRRMVLIALFAALIAVFTQIIIPLPSGIPITLQTFMIALCGYYLGWKQGLIAVAVYLLLGLCGAPVFTAFGAGPAKVAGVTGGYLWGFLPMVMLCGLRVKQRWLAFLLGVLGMVACHLCGTVQFAFVSGNGPLTAFLTASAPYLIKDSLSVFLAMLIAQKLPYKKHA